MATQHSRWIFQIGRERYAFDFTSTATRLRPDRRVPYRLQLQGHALWQRRFGGDPSVVGKILAIEGKDRARAGSYSVVGVMKDCGGVEQELRQKCGAIRGRRTSRRTL